MTKDRSGELSKEELRNDVINRLESFGFTKENGEWQPPTHEDKKKEVLREIHSERLKRWLSEYEDWIRDNEDRLFDHFADGSDVVPENIEPNVIQVENRKERDLFRYAKYTWSLPMKQGWGRGIRYLVMDDSNDKVIGIFGLTDPVFNLKARDDWIGWSTEEREERLKQVMDAYILGAVPPYNDLLGGKLVASLACSNRVRDDIREKYGGKESLISGEIQEGEAVLLTTASAWGKSSMLSRLQYHDRLMWKHVGSTSGYGHFHLDSGLADKMKEYLKQIDDPEVEKNEPGDGPSPKLRYMRRCLNLLNIDQSVMEHGIQRGFYAAPLAENFKSVLVEGEQPNYYDMSEEDIFDFFRDRYLIDRAERITRWKDHDSEDVRVTNKLNELLNDYLNYYVN
jgi:hypothetical protein